MNKKVLKVAFVAAIALVSGINVFNAQKTEVLSDTVLANVDALAGDVELSEKYKYVYRKQPGDPGYPETICVCSGKNGDLPCC